jgi:hypothetical protein
MTRPLVTIITPSYQQAAYLEAALRSVLEQDYPALEYLVVDGGSTDGSVEIIQDHARRYAPAPGQPLDGQGPRLVWWVSEMDAGQADAINKGLARARGEFVAWLNSDDLYLPGTVSRAAAALQANPAAAFVYGNALSINAAGALLNRREFTGYSLLDLMKFRIICQPAVFMRRSYLEQAGRLDASYHFLLDHMLWLRLARLAPAVHLPGEPLAADRHHAQAKNVARATEAGQEAARILDWIAAQPDLAAFYNANRRRIAAGAQRLSARYLLDGGQPGAALQAYARALLLSPVFTLQHAHRMAYAALSLIGLGQPARHWYYRLRRRFNPKR